MKKTMLDHFRNILVTISIILTFITLFSLYQDRLKGNNFNIVLILLMLMYGLSIILSLKNKNIESIEHIYDDCPRPYIKAKDITLKDAANMNDMFFDDDTFYDEKGNYIGYSE